MLVIEDDRLARESLADALREDGFEVAIAEDGLAGLQRLHAGYVPRVILLDVYMPRLDGESFLRAIRADPRYADLPVITVTAAEEPPQGDVLAHMHKPFDMEDLLAIVRSLCEPTVGAPPAIDEPEWKAGGAPGSADLRRSLQGRESGSE